MWYLPIQVYRITTLKSLSPTFSITIGVCIYQISLLGKTKIASAQALSHHTKSIKLITKKVLFLKLVIIISRKNLLTVHTLKYQLLILFSLDVLLLTFLKKLGLRRYLIWQEMHQKVTILQAETSFTRILWMSFMIRTFKGTQLFLGGKWHF